MEYVKVEDFIVTNLISTDRKHDEPWIHVDISGGIRVGSDIRHYDENWKMKPAQRLVDEGHIKLKVSDENNPNVKPGTVLQKVEDGRIVDKTNYELVMEDAIELTKFEYVEDGEVKLKSEYMLAVEGVVPVPSGHYINHTTKEVIAHQDVAALHEQGKVDEEVYYAWQVKNRHNTLSTLITEVDQAVSNPIRWMDFEPVQQQELAVYRRALIAARKDVEDFSIEIPTLSFDLGEV